MYIFMHACIVGLLYIFMFANQSIKTYAAPPLDPFSDAPPI